MAFKILVGQDQHLIDITISELQDYELLVVTSYFSALEKLKQSSDIDLFLIGIHLEESQAVELVRVIRKSSIHSAKPILIIRLGKSEHPELLRQSISVLKKANLLEDYLELEGDPRAGQKIRRAVENMLQAAAEPS